MKSIRIKDGKRVALKGYKGRDPISHRKSNLYVQYRRFKDGKMTYRGVPPGSGHAAGEKWGEQKGIDPNSQVLKYSKNSPSFDEGVWTYKKNSKNQAILSKQGN